MTLTIPTLNKVPCQRLQTGLRIFKVMKHPVGIYQSEVTIDAIQPGEIAAAKSYISPAMQQTVPSGPLQAYLREIQRGNRHVRVGDSHRVRSECTAARYQYFLCFNRWEALVKARPEGFQVERVGVTASH